ncbi:hypothetical protein MA16_Dca002466 [Dendrobium catenatum]|uniref:Uncharacterized protein n=1 Tax=Dendrobium catenatum TaxID=906689 RepID=A0A2I0W0L7_9ASPA|nr:hypothetical protein MA16_Dca002466 [Dendrobium catenatum]
MGFEVISWPLEDGAIVMDLSTLFGSSNMFLVGCIGDVLKWDLILTKSMDSTDLILEDLGVIAEGWKGMETFVSSLDSQFFFEVQVLFIKNLKDLKFIGLSHVSVMREVIIISSYGFGKNEADYWPVELGVSVIASSTLLCLSMVIVIGSFEVSTDSSLDWSALSSKDVEDDPPPSSQTESPSTGPYPPYPHPYYYPYPGHPEQDGPSKPVEVGAGDHATTTDKRQYIEPKGDK